MFGKKKSNKANHVTSVPGRFETVIGEGTVINGQVLAQNGLRIDGQVLGDVEIAQSPESALAISKSGVVRGNIKGDRVLIAGTVEGSIFARDWVELQVGSSVTGDIYYRTLSIEPGAIIAGKLVAVVEAVEPPLLAAPTSDSTGD